MLFDTESSKLTGIPDKLTWTQVHEFKPEDKQKFEKRGEIFAVISIARVGRSDQDEEMMDNVSLGREVLLRFHEEYFGDLTKGSFDALGAALSKVRKEFEGKGLKVEIVATAIVDGIIYSAAIGGSSFWILRDSAIARILESGDSVVTASGFPKENDILILGTKAFFDNFAEGQIRAALSAFEIQKSLELFAPKIHSLKLASAGIVLVKIKKTQVEDEFQELVIAKKKLGEGQDVYKFKEKPLDQNPLKQFLNIFKKFNFGKKFYVKKDELSFEQSKRRKVSASIGLLLIILLILSVLFGIKQKKIKEEISLYDSKIKEAEHLIEEASSLYTLDPVQARETFSKAKDIVKELEQKKIEDKRIDTLSQSLREKQGKLLGEYVVTLDEFFDLTLVSNEFRGRKITSYDKKIFVLENGGERIISVDVGGKGSSVTAGPSLLKSLQDFSVYSDRIFFVNDEGLFETEGENLNKISEKNWFGNVLIYTYAGNIYLLEKDSSMIWRYSSTQEGFAGKSNWLAEGQRLDLTESVDWTIDGSIWVLDAKGRILKLVLGNKQSFDIKGVEPDIEKIDVIYTNEAAKGLYLLENAKNRIIVVGKDGNYIAQYLIQNQKIMDLVVFEDEKKAILLEGGKLYSISLLHLE